MWHGGCFSPGQTTRDLTTTEDQETPMAAIARISENHKRIAILAMLSFIALC